MAEGTVFPFNRDDETQSDLVRMANVDVPNMLNTLAVRHELKKIYTNVGAASILISIDGLLNAKLRWRQLREGAGSLESFCAEVGVHNDGPAHLA